MEKTPAFPALVHPLLSLCALSLSLWQSPIHLCLSLQGFSAKHPLILDSLLESVLQHTLFGIVTALRALL